MDNKATTIAILGPPRSGKSVFLSGLVQNLPRAHYYLFRANPDGEGTWTWRSPDNAVFRRKGTFREENVEWYIQTLRKADLAPIVLIDLGGKITSENERILTEGGVEHAIILSSDPEKISEWEELVQKTNTQVLARIVSDYHGTVDNVSTDPMRVHYLERGEDVSSRPVIQHVAGSILNLPKVREQIKIKEANQMDFIKVDQEKQEATLSIPGLAKDLGKETVKRTLPNGREVEQIVWEGSDLKEISKKLHNISGNLPEHVKIDGPAPAWLATALVHEIHPRSASLNSPDGFVPIGMKKPTGTGTGENLTWKVGEADGWHVVHVEQKDPSIPINPKELDNIAPPELPMGSKVVLSGRAPNWLMASATMAYHGGTKAVALYQPGVGGTVAMTHSQDVELGSTVPEATIKAALEENKLEKALGAFENNAPKPSVFEEKIQSPRL